MSTKLFSTMSSRQRWLAAIRHEPLDRLPFWPKLDNAYAPAQQSPFTDLQLSDMHDWIGSDPHTMLPSVIREIRQQTSVQVSVSNEQRTTLFQTPYGQMKKIEQFDAASYSWHPQVFPVKSVQDIRLMTCMYEDLQLELDETALAKAQSGQQQTGEDAMTRTAIGQSPLMHWVEWLAGIENAHFLLMDYPSDVQALFDAMHRSLMRRTQLTCQNHPANLLYFIENTSTTLISPDQYRQFCLQHIGAYARIAQAAGRDIILHMCGHLKALLDDLQTLPVTGFEAFTAPTLGNTTLLEGRTHCPDKTIIGGTHAMIWLEPAKQIIQFIEQRLDELPHHRGIVVTSAGIMPPLCPPLRIKTVCDWLKGYPLKM